MQIKSLQGLIHYEKARLLQLEMVEKRIRDEIPDTLIFLEHEPVVTQGSGLQQTGSAEGIAEDLGPKPSLDSKLRKAPRPVQLPSNVLFCETERGGDLTVHVPGQWVVYPIVKTKDLSAHLLRLENAGIQAIKNLAPEFNGLVFKHRPKATGLWCENSSGELKKVGSIGVALKGFNTQSSMEWVTYHGMSINVVNDLSLFSLVSPCGFESSVMTRLCDLVPSSPVWASGKWRERLESEFTKFF